MNSRLGTNPVQEFLLKTISLVVFIPNITTNHAITYTNWIVLIKSEILITTGMLQPDSSEKWKALSNRHLLLDQKMSVLY